MISFTPFNDRMSSGLRVQGKDTYILIRKERIQSLPPPLRLELLATISKGLSKKPFEITNLIFDQRGAKTQTIEWRINESNEHHVLFFDRGFTIIGDWSMVVTPIDEQTYPVLREILLWMNDCLN